MYKVKKCESPKLCEKIIKKKDLWSCLFSTSDTISLQLGVWYKQTS